MTKNLLNTTFLIITLLIQCSHQNRELKEVTIKGKTIMVEMARTPQKISKGLSFRDELARNHGMFFIFPDEGKKTFWMFGCRFDVDVAFIDASGLIREIKTMKQEKPGTPVDSMKRYTSESSRIRYALEMEGGWFRENDIHPGDSVNLREFFQPTGRKN